MSRFKEGDRVRHSCGMSGTVKTVCNDAGYHVAWDNGSVWWAPQIALDRELEPATTLRQRVEMARLAVEEAAMKSGCVAVVLTPAQARALKTMNAGDALTGDIAGALLRVSMAYDAWAEGGDDAGA